MHGRREGPALAYGARFGIGTSAPYARARLPVSEHGVASASDPLSGPLLALQEGNPHVTDTASNA